jgi:hypothetical protein
MNKKSLPNLIIKKIAFLDLNKKIVEKTNKQKLIINVNEFVRIPAGYIIFFPWYNFIRLGNFFQYFLQLQWCSVPMIFRKFGRKKTISAEFPVFRF